jgi:CBS domain-containing protein
MERIADFMSSPIISIDSQSTAEDAAKHMGKKKYNVTSNKRKTRVCRYHYFNRPC